MDMDICRRHNDKESDWNSQGWNLNVRPPAPETNALPLDQLLGILNAFFSIYICSV